MNFLAHLYFTAPDPAEMVGGLMPDLVRGKLPDNLEPAVSRGVANHRKVDAFTDTHPAFNRSRALLRPTQGIFSGILVDVFYDHFLSTHWDVFHAKPLRDFIAQAHAALSSHERLMPPRMQFIIHRMVAQGWLMNYDTPDGLRLTLEMMSRRFAERTERDIDLTPAVDDLLEHYAAMQTDFLDFFPQAIRFIGVDHRPKQTPRSVA